MTGADDPMGSGTRGSRASRTWLMWLVVLLVALAVLLTILFLGRNEAGESERITRPGQDAPTSGG